MQFLEAKKALARKLDINYSDIANDGLWTDTDLGALIQFGVLKAWDYKPWPFTQAVKTATTLVGVDYYDHPQDLMAGSINFMQVGGKQYRKLSMPAYLQYFQRFPNGTDRIWAEQQSFIFINKNSYSQGVDTFDLYGKKLAPELSNTTDLLPFSPISDSEEHSGNEAIVQLAYAEALDSEKKKNPQAAELERKKAYFTLDLLWKPLADEISRQNQIGRPMFEVPSFFWRGYNPTGYPIGNFPFWD